MIECDGCGKRHRDKQKVIACRLRKEKRDARAAAKQADLDRRQRNAQLHPLRDRIQELRLAGGAWVNVAKAIRDDYPRPVDWAHECGQQPCPVEMMAHRDWDVVLVLGLDTERYQWPSAESLAQQWRLYSTTQVEEKTPWKTTTHPDGGALVWGSDLAEVTKEEEYIADSD